MSSSDPSSTSNKWSQYIIGIYMSRRGPQPLGTVEYDKIEQRAQDKLKDYPGEFNHRKKYLSRNVVELDTTLKGKMIVADSDPYQALLCMREVVLVPAKHTALTFVPLKNMELSLVCSSIVLPAT